MSCGLHSYEGTADRHLSGLICTGCCWQVLLGRARRIALLLQQQVNQASPQPLLQVSQPQSALAHVPADVRCQHQAPQALDPMQTTNMRPQTMCHSTPAPTDTTPASARSTFFSGSPGEGQRSLGTAIAVGDAQDARSGAGRPRAPLAPPAAAGRTAWRRRGMLASLNAVCCPVAHGAIRGGAKAPGAKQQHSNFLPGTASE